jgi:hypothetical protein
MAAILYGELFYGTAKRVLYTRNGGFFHPTVEEKEQFRNEPNYDIKAFTLKRFEKKLATFNLGSNVYAFVESNVKGSPVRASETVETDYVVWIDDLDFLMFAWQDEMDEAVLLRVLVDDKGDFQVVIGNPFGEEVYTYRRWKEDRNPDAVEETFHMTSREEFEQFSYPMGNEILEHFKDYDYEV